MAIWLNLQPTRFIGGRTTRSFQCAAKSRLSAVRNTQVCESNADSVPRGDCYDSESSVAIDNPEGLFWTKDSQRC